MTLRPIHNQDLPWKASNTFTTTTLFTGISSTLNYFPSALVLMFISHDRPENILYRTKKSDSDIVIVDFGMYELTLVQLLYEFNPSLVRSICTPPRNSYIPLPVALVMSPRRCSWSKDTANPSTCGPLGENFPMSVESYLYPTPLVSLPTSFFVDIPLSGPKTPRFLSMKQPTPKSCSMKGIGRIPLVKVRLST